MREINLPDNIKKTMDEFLRLLKGAYGDGLVSVVLYGSAASGDYSGRHSNINMAVILKDASIGSLSKMSAFINKRKFMIINPVFFYRRLYKALDRRISYRVYRYEREQPCALWQGSF